jgi:hypothetical protein
MSLLAIHKNNSKLLLRCQYPPPGPIDILRLEWASTSSAAETNDTLLDAIIPYDRFDDFLTGEKARGRCHFSISRRQTNEHLDAPKLLSFKQSVDYHCEFGPEDLRLYTEDYTKHVAAKAGEGIVPVLSLPGRTLYVSLITWSPLKVRHYIYEDMESQMVAITDTYRPSSVEHPAAMNPVLCLHAVLNTAELLTFREEEELDRAWRECQSGLQSRLHSPTAVLRPTAGQNPPAGEAVGARQSWSSTTCRV